MQETETMAKTIWAERFSMQQVLGTMRGLEAKGPESFITSCGESWRGGFIDGRICYVLFAAGLMKRQEQTGHYIPQSDTAQKAYEFSVRHFWRMTSMSGRMVAREFSRA